MERRWVVSPEYRALIETIVSARKARGVGQRELSRRLGKHPSFVNKVENLERRLDVLEFVVIARAIGVEPHVLLHQIAAAIPNDLQL